MSLMLFGFSQSEFMGLTDEIHFSAGGCWLNKSQELSALYEEHRDDEGFLRVKYASRKFYG